MLPTFLQPYGKAVIAILGIALLIFVHKADLTIPGLDAVILDMVIGGLTSLGVYQVRNAEK